MARGPHTFSDSTPEDPARLVVRMAIRAFGDGVRAGDWLAQPSEMFNGEAPLFVAKESVAGWARVCEVPDGLVSR